MNKSANTRAAYPVRLPQELLDWIKAQALADARSVNGQIQYLLQQARNKADQEAQR